MRSKGVAKVSLERALSKLGYASRTVARALIQDGKVTVQGRVVKEPEFRVDLKRCVILVDGNKIQAQETLVLLLHKPKGLVTTARDEKGRATVFECLKKYPEWVDKKISAVGRLDQATSGLLVLTNHNRLLDWLLDPKNQVLKKYLVQVRGEWSAQKTQECLRGVMDEGERLQAKAVEILKASGRESLLVMELHEGKNREIRRMTAALGHEVQSLKRVQFGVWTLLDPKTQKELEIGEVRKVELKELDVWVPEQVLKKPV